MVIAFLKMNPFHHKLNPNKPESLNGGEYNGYVAFDSKLPPSWQGGADFDDESALDHLVDVHGGITLDCPMADWLDEPIIPLTSIPDRDTLKKFRCIGFDTLHYDDTRERWTLEATKEETLNLMKQIKTLCDE